MKLTMPEIVVHAENYAEARRKMIMQLEAELRRLKGERRKAARLPGERRREGPRAASDRRSG